MQPAPAELPQPSAEVVMAVVELLATRPDEEIESRVLALVGDAMMARRLIDCIPEAFGLVLAVRLQPQGRFQLPKSFSVQGADGNWHDFPLDAEPLFPLAIRIANHMFMDGPRAWVETVCNRSAVTDTLNNALNAGGMSSLKGATLSGPAWIGIPAEIYGLPA